MKQAGRRPEEMSDRDALSQDLLDLERRGWDALCSVNGARFYDDLMTDDALMVFPGTVMTKRESVAAIAAERPWTDYRIEDARAARGRPWRDRDVPRDREPTGAAHV